MGRQVNKAKCASFKSIFRKIDIFSYYRPVLSVVARSENTAQKSKVFH